MPITVYMARDPRRDHGFTIPDPLLTREHGIPNACNRCHTQPGESVDWAVDWVEKWYGDRMERATRRRARLVARAHANDESVVPDLVAYAREEPIGAWRATLVALAGEWSPRPDAMNLLSDSLADGDPLVRAAAARALRPHSEAHQRLAPLLKDPVRLVRIDAAWALLDSLDRRSENYTELRSYLAEICDQPGGAHRMGQLALAEEQPRAAEQWMRKAVDWDRTSPGLRYDLGLLLNAVGKPGDAIEEMERARQLDPRAPLYPYSLGLLYAEAGNLEKTIERLEEAVRLDPTFARAWYNLGLAQAERDSLDQAVEALRKAEALDAANPEFPYARATVHMRKGEYGEARRAAEAALTIDPGSEAARALLEELPPSAPPPGS